MEPIYTVVERCVSVLGLLRGVPIFLEGKQTLSEALAVDLAPAYETTRVAHEDVVEACVESLRRESMWRGKQCRKLIREPFCGGTNRRHDEWTRFKLRGEGSGAKLLGTIAHDGRGRDDLHEVGI